MNDRQPWQRIYTVAELDDARREVAELRAENMALKAAIREYLAAQAIYKPYSNDEGGGYSIDDAERLEAALHELQRLAEKEGAE